MGKGGSFLLKMPTISNLLRILPPSPVPLAGVTPFKSINVKKVLNIKNNKKMLS
jgi:hypothetical protein